MKETRDAVVIVNIGAAAGDSNTKMTQSLDPRAMKAADAAVKLQDADGEPNRFAKCIASPTAQWFMKMFIKIGFAAGVFTILSAYLQPQQHRWASWFSFLLIAALIASD